MRGFFSTEEVFKTRNVAIMAMMVVLKIILSRFSIYVTPTFKLFSFDYLPGAMVAVLFGPWASLAFGLVADTVGFWASSSGGAYFPGYAISEMAANFIYACFLYKQPIRVWRVLASRLVITVVVTFGLNYIWNVIMYGTIASKYFTTVRLVNNLVQMPVQVALIFVLGLAVLKIEKRSGVFRS